MLSLIIRAQADPAWHTLQRNVPAAVSKLTALNRYPLAGEMHLAIGLPVTDPAALKSFLDDLYNPGSPQYRQYLTPEQFTARFGPSEAAYVKVIEFARSNHLAIVGTHANRMLLEVKASPADVEQAFQVHLNWYQHPSEARQFFAPDREPSIPADVPILHISGLDNFQLPRSQLKYSALTNSVTHVGTGPNNYGYMGTDFRNAYVPGLTNTGAGQSVGLVEFDGYYPTDIARYNADAHINNNVVLSNVLINGYSGAASVNNVEVALDIEMALAMAPGLARILVYEETYPNTNATLADLLFNRIATDNGAKQISCSWVVPTDATTEQIFQEYAAQGQSFFNAAGDSGALLGEISPPADDPYITQVGGTTLTTSSAGGPWQSEVVWNNNGGASSGGVSDVYPIPAWQESVDFTGTGGSPYYRNFPDVSLVADQVFIVANNGQAQSVGGTSCAAPLWAGLTALINQQAAVTGKSSVGFINPAIYRLYGQNNYTANFHDISVGNNVIATTVQQFTSGIGYDLCTGVGTPIGNELINSLLATPDPLVVTPQSTVYITGPAGGPFNIRSATLTLTNTGSASLNWAVLNPDNWLTLSTNNGTLAGHGSAPNLGLTLNSAANALSPGVYDTTLWFTNLNTHLAQALHVALSVGQSLPLNGGFEAGDFSDWILTGDNSTYDFVDNGSVLPFTAHSGFYFMSLGEPTLPMATLFQNIPTFAGQPYSLTFYFANPDIGGGTAPNEFSVSWNGTTLSDQVNVGTLNTWNARQFNVLATNTVSTLTFAAYNLNSFFGIDDVSLTALPLPNLTAMVQNGNRLNLAWNTTAGFNYQLQSNTNLTGKNWIPLGPSVNASSSTLSSSDTITANSSKFYRVVLQP